MLTSGAHHPVGFSFCDEGVYRLYTTEEQDGEHPDDAIVLLFAIESYIAFFESLILIIFYFWKLLYIMMFQPRPFIGAFQSVIRSRWNPIAPSSRTENLSMTDRPGISRHY